MVDTYGEDDVFTLGKLLDDLSLQVVAHGSERPAPRVVSHAAVFQGAGLYMGQCLMELVMVLRKR